MKKLIVILVFAMLLINLSKVMTNEPLAKTYVVDNCVVVKTLPEGCQFKDANGNKWIKMYGSNDERYSVGDVVTLTIYDKGTEFPKDDSILKIERVG